MQIEKPPKSQPRYLEVADTLLADIVAGRFPVGTMLPTELELCDRFGVSRFTVREALRRLDQMGLVSRRQGSGTVVQATESRSAFVQSLGSISELLQYPKETRLHVVSSEEVVADRKLARLLRCRVGERQEKISGVRRIDASGKAICWTDVYVIPEYAGVAEVIGKKTLPVYTLIEEKYDEKVVRVAVELFAGRVPEELSAHLEVEPDTPALIIVRRYTGRDDRVFEVSVGVHPENRFTYFIELKQEWEPAGGG